MGSKAMTEILKFSNQENINENIIQEKMSIVELPVFFKRAVCIHSSLQFVDLLMQSVMFSHGFSSTPVIPNLEEEEEVVSKTIANFRKIRKEFREIFRSRNRNTLSEVAIFVGTCPVRSAYSYRIPMYICEAEDSTNQSCGNTCAELNDFERRKINRDLFMHSTRDHHTKNMTNRNHRLFVFVKGSESMVNEEVEEEDPPFNSSSCHQYSFIHDNCNCQRVPSIRTDGKWLRIVPFIVHSKN